MLNAALITRAIRALTALLSLETRAALLSRASHSLSSTGCEYKDNRNNVKIGGNAYIVITVLSDMNKPVKLVKLIKLIKLI